MADNDLFLSKMRALGVQPLKENRRRKSAEPPEPSLLFEPEVEESESTLFLQAMDELGLPAEQYQARDSGSSEKMKRADQTNEVDHLRETDDSKSPGLKSPWHPSEGHPENAEEDRQLFLDAIETLDRQPSKIDHPIPRTQEPVRRLKPPRAPTQVDETLDLHRMRVQDALTRLESFLAQAVQNRFGQVLVITGKGHHSRDGISVLNRAVEDWVRREGRGSVQSFSEAAPAQGGRGAFVLHLRPA